MRDARAAEERAREAKPTSSRAPRRHAETTRRRARRRSDPPSLIAPEERAREAEPTSSRAPRRDGLRSLVVAIVDGEAEAVAGAGDAKRRALPASGSPRTREGRGRRQPDGAETSTGRRGQGSSPLRLSTRRRAPRLLTSRADHGDHGGGRGRGPRDRRSRPGRRLQPPSWASLRQRRRSIRREPGASRSEVPRAPSPPPVGEAQKPPCRKRRSPCRKRKPPCGKRSPTPRQRTIRPSSEAEDPAGKDAGSGWGAQTPMKSRWPKFRSSFDWKIFDAALSMSYSTRRNENVRVSTSNVV